MKSNRKVIIAIVAAALIILIAILVAGRGKNNNLNNNITEQPQQNEVVENTQQQGYDDPNAAPIKNVIPPTVDVKNIKKYVKGKYRYEIAVPSIKAQTNPSIESYVNASTSGISKDLIKRVKNDSSPNSQIDDEAGMGSISEANMGVVSTFSSDKVFSLSVMTSFINGKGNQSNYMKSYNYLLGYDKKITMAEITGSDQAKLDTINASIKKQLDDKKVDLYNDKDYILKMKNNNFYIKEGKLIIFYNERVIASGSEGIIEAEVMLSDIGFNESYPNN